MKRFSILLIFSLLLSGLCAQNWSTNKDELRKQRWEEMKAKRAAFYTERIGLTAGEAQAFWPVYYELQSKKEKLHRYMRNQFKNIKKDTNGKRIMDYGKMNDEMINLRLQEATLEKAYHARFKKILSPEKLFRYYGAERDWANQLLKEIEKRGNRR